MRDEWEIVYDSDMLQPCSDRALVMHSLGIPYELVSSDGRAALAVPSAYAERARYEIWQFETENRKPAGSRLRASHTYQDGVPGAAAYVAVVCAAAWLSGSGAFGADWFAAGRIDGESIRQGEWWRLFTALTLHSGTRHLIGNIGFGVLFGFLAGRLVGSGLAWFAIVVASGVANALNTLLLESAHRSIGASTAVFAALGLVAGFVWWARLMVQDRWPYRLGPVVGGIALLAFTGTGDENTDVGAHLAGFVCGFAAGMLLTRLRELAMRRGLQLACGAGALGIVLAAWLAAFGLPGSGS